MYKTINELTIDHRSNKIVQLTSIIARLANDLRKSKTQLIREQIEARQIRRRYMSVVHAYENNTSWDWLRVAGGDKDFAKQLKRNTRDAVSGISRDVAAYSLNIDNEQKRYDEYMSELTQQNMLLKQAYTSDSRQTHYATKDWEHELRNCDNYVKGSIKLKHKYQRHVVFETGQGGGFLDECYEDYWKVTLRFTPMTAWSSNTDRNISDAGIYIPSITADFLIDKRRAGRHRYTTVLRASPGFAKHRYKGYRDLKVLHPHMTDTTNPCLGDFEGPITEALDNFDIPTAVVVLSMFLQQFDPADPAGGHYRNFPKADEIFAQESAA